VRGFHAAGRDRCHAEPDPRDAGRRTHRSRQAGFNGHRKRGPVDAAVSHDNHERADLPREAADGLANPDADRLVLGIVAARRAD
jgi:hypothetical protein